ncbi:hypothetical protein [Aeromicrobium sp. Sec7.5]|uniref:hypothetical protein n=1 Tax=Aeromicrobium sp. Sec7.5 TaxID=3121276 RepID=UPI002FE4F8A5
METERRFGRSLAWMFGGIGLLWAAAVVAYALAADSNPPGQCEGIGFGCTLTPRDSVLFAMMFLGVPITVGTVVVGTFWVAFWHTRWGAMATGLSALATGLVVSVAFAAGLMAG